MSEFVTNMFQYNVTVGITRSEVIFFLVFLKLINLLIMETRNDSTVRLDEPPMMGTVG